MCLTNASASSLTYRMSCLQSQSQDGRGTDRETEAQRCSGVRFRPHSKPGAWRPPSSPTAQLPHTHPVLIEVVSVHTGPLEAELAVAAAGAVCPGEVAGLAHHLPLRLAGTPQLGAVLHVGTRLRAHAEGQLTLLAQAVAGTRQVLGQGDGLAGGVQEAVAYREPRAFVRAELRKA